MTGWDGEFWDAGVWDGGPQDRYPHIGGRTVAVEAFYPATITRDYGDSVYGDEYYGDDPANDGAPEWHDFACDVVSFDIVRGDEAGSRVLPVDQLLILADDTAGQLFPFVHAGMPDVAGIGPGVPVRVTVGGIPIMTGRIESITDNHKSPRYRLIEIEAFGFASDGVYDASLPGYVVEPVSTRAGRLVAAYLPALPDTTPAGIELPDDNVSLAATEAEQTTITARLHAASPPLPIRRLLSPSRFSTASCAPVDAPEGTAARPKLPSSSSTSTSTVGLPRLSRI